MWVSVVVATVLEVEVTALVVPFVAVGCVEECDACLGPLARLVLVEQAKQAEFDEEQLPPLVAVVPMEFVDDFE